MEQTRKELLKNKELLKETSKHVKQLRNTQLLIKMAMGELDDDETEGEEFFRMIYNQHESSIVLLNKYINELQDKILDLTIDES